MKANTLHCAGAMARELLCKVAWLKPKAKLSKGTNGRYNSAPDGDRFRDLITRRESAGFTESNPGIERVRRHGILAPDGRGEDGQARAIPMNFGRSGSHPSTEWPMSQKARSATINLGVSQEEL
jgi:hypothetical protein